MSHKCLYCREVDQVSTTLEHFIPERLGEGHPFTLPVGAVCDRCQNWASHDVDLAIWEADIVLRHWLGWFQVPGKRGKIGVLTGKPGDVFDPKGRMLTMSPDERTESQKDRDELFFSRAIYKIALGALARSVSLERALAPEFDPIGRELRSGSFLPYRRAVGRWIDQGVGMATQVLAGGKVVAIQLYAVTYWACLVHGGAQSAFEALDPLPGSRIVLAPDHGPIGEGMHPMVKQDFFQDRVVLTVTAVKFGAGGLIDPQSFLFPGPPIQVLPQDSPGWRDGTSG